MSTVDNLIALKVLYKLVTPFDKTEAYKLGVIDANGTLLIKSKDQTPEQKDAYDYLDRLVFNLKRILAKVPGGKSMFASMVAALYLIKEDTKMTQKELEERFNDVLSKILNQEVTLVEEELIVEDFLILLEDGAVGGAPANVTGAAVSTDIPAIRKKKPRKYATYEVDDSTFNKFAKGKKKFKKWTDYLNLNDETHAKIYQFAKKNPRGVLVLKNGDKVKGIRYNKNGGGKWHKIARRGKPIQMLQTEELC